MEYLSKCSWKELEKRKGKGKCYDYFHENVLNIKEELRAIKIKWYMRTAFTMCVFAIFTMKNGPFVLQSKILGQE